MITNHFFRGFTHSRSFMIVVLLVIDWFSIFFAYSITVLMWKLFKQTINISFYASLIPIIFIFIIAYAFIGLYSVVGQSPIITLRLIIVATSLVFLFLSSYTFYFQKINVYSRGIILVSWILSLLFVPFFRSSIIKLLSRRRLWGEEVIIIGLNNRTEKLIQLLFSQPEFGLIPVYILDFSSYKSNEKPILQIPIFNISEDIDFNLLRQSSKIETAIIISDNSDQKIVRNFIKNGAFHFSRILYFPQKMTSSLWVEPFNIGGTLGFEIQQNLLNFFHQKMKRMMDLVIIITFFPFVLLIGCFIALAIKLDSNGPIFFKTTRIGYGGIPFIIWKFRTMVKDANEQREKYFKLFPELEEEWKRNHKLKHDPRITRVGRILRRFSLDEFPQIINVLFNEMSLVGPRPIVKEEIEKYGDMFELYKQVKPGLTGLWQVSGRNDVSYEKRIELDEFYVRNYSIWMDLYIFSKTIEAVITNRGAY